MDLAKHCELCDNQKVNLKEGTTCGLDGRKPFFNKTCLKIELNEKFERKLKEINIKYEKLRSEKAVTYTYFVVFLIIGSLVILAGFLLGKYILENGVIATAPLIIMGVGLAPLGLAFGTLNNYRQELEIATKKKNQIDHILELYRIDYKIDIKFGEKYHGNQDVYVNLKVNKRSFN